MRIAVIGAAGFLGSHTMEQAWSEKREVVGLDLVHDGYYATKRIDVRWPWETVKRILEHDGIEAVINYAGLLGTAELFDNVEGAIRVNIEGQYNVARACLELDIPLVTIEQPHIWTNPYETTRGAGVRLARGLAHHKGLSLATVTTYNAFGERQGYGGWHPQKFVPTFSVHAWNKEPLPIYGSGEQMVNAIYAREIAKVFLTAIPAASPQSPHFMGAAVGGNFTVNEIADLVERVTTMRPFMPHRKHLDMRDGETDDDFGASAPRTQIQGNAAHGVYVPKFTPLDFHRTVNWYKDVGLDDTIP